MGFLKYDKLGKEEPRRKANKKGYNIGRYIAGHINATDCYHFLWFPGNHFYVYIRLQQEVVTYEEYKKA
jgi:hypothetical protein